MTDISNDGGPAFPTSVQGQTSFSGQPVQIDYTGMSLRDAFALAAIIGMNAYGGHTTTHRGKDEAASVRARSAFRQADAMLAQRSKP